MATAPERPQPLHNFFLPQLKWAHNSPSNYRFRRRTHTASGAANNASGSDSEVPSGGSRPEKDEKASGAEAGENGVVSAMPETRTWNLRPRKTTSLRSGEMQETGSGNAHIPPAKTQRQRGAVVEDEGGHQWVEKKRRLWISLSKEEIEEDVYSMTGSRPARRPKKRPRNVQKLVDNVFPGLYLVGISVDSYRAESQM